MTLPLSIYSAYGSLALFLSILHNIFLLYHVETFVSIYKIDQQTFWIGETIFLLWNSLNDPLFGWISDKHFLTKKVSNSGTAIVIHRITALGKTGPLFSMAFLLFWYLWIPAGIQFVICLCLYDSFLTIIDLQHTALLADLALSSRLRAKLNSYNSVFSCLGSSSVFLSYLFWSHDDPVSFRIFCLVLAIISGIGFKICCYYLTTYYKSSASVTEEKYRSITEVNPSLTETQNLKSYIKQLSSHPNFLWFTVMNLVQ
ncbi:transmembrane protein 180-like isoform X1 [Centruroides sculpturatus]|uniref:transmembrane protein 180-like isoform X1 n=1 Tax=Centruroides sculpturatus TaxID=218467 RepID=UPI000C6D59FF|nr:transmembrane protein 180-like isoform X1 [Centruroides sculpturatus]XP_023244065.1 transmembrane protein 180-like isoform X1 [Centruroides sculpturatus]